MNGLAYKIHREEKATIMRLTMSNITVEENEELKKAFSDLLYEGSKNIVLDLSDTTFVSSVILASLVFMLKRAKEAGGDLVICGAKGRVKDILVMTNLDKVFGTFDDAQKAITHYTQK
ncbi:STAS domain-containing protein [Omnitrophica bacterium]|nr:STAS domain-containing protein [Candidatus Omnitrophota bacterium]